MKLPAILGASLYSYQEKEILDKFIVSEEEKCITLIDTEWEAKRIIEDLKLLNNPRNMDFLNTWGIDVMRDGYYCFGAVMIKIYYEEAYDRTNIYQPYSALIYFHTLNFNPTKTTVGYKELSNFKYNLEAIKLGMINNPDLKKAVTKNPEKDWTEEIIKLWSLT